MPKVALPVRGGIPRVGVDAGGIPATRGDLLYPSHVPRNLRHQRERLGTGELSTAGYMLSAENTRGV